MKTRKCPKCNGTGRAVYSEGAPYRSMQGTCPECKGSGSLGDDYFLDPNVPADKKMQAMFSNVNVGRWLLIAVIGTAIIYLFLHFFKK
jgi:hypothetical protein